MRGIIAGVLMTIASIALFVNLLDIAIYHDFIKRDIDIAYGLLIPLSLFFVSILIEKRTYFKCNAECKQYNSAFWGLISSLVLLILVHINDKL